MADDLVVAIRDDEARVNITFAGQNGELPQPVFRDAADGDIKAWVTEAVRNGGVPGIRADLNANFNDYVVDRFPPTEARPHNLIQVRPKTAFGMVGPGRCFDKPQPDPNVTQPSRHVERCPHCYRPY